MTLNQAANPDVALGLARAVVGCSSAPALLLDHCFAVVAASTSFCQAFSADGGDVAGESLFALGYGEWDTPRLRSLLNATFAGDAAIDSYEMDFKGGAKPRQLILTARKLDYSGDALGLLLLTIVDVTDARIAEKLKDELLRQQVILLQEVNHRVANSLQIIASVLMQSARRVQSEETRGHLADAHHRVMSIASVQRHLASSSRGDVALRSYFTVLCQSLGASMIRDHNHLGIDVVADDSTVPADISVSLGLIVTELVINALRHAFPGDRGGTITVGYQANGLSWNLSVRDDGIGTVSSTAASGRGLGSSIVEALANRLSAAVERRGLDPGTLVSVEHLASRQTSNDVVAA
jgi:two-component sensor histidine kinase